MQKFSKVFTLMSVILALTFCAVSCKTDDDDEPTMYTVTVSDSIEHGKVTADKSSAEAGAKVKLTATADSGYELDSYSVKDASANALTVTEGTFAMPASNVTVSATFKETAVTPQKTAGSISYATTTVSKTAADEAFTNTLAKTGDGTVTYASSKTDVAEVDATTGEVTIKGAGTATITATVADSESYTYATKTASYTLTVTYIGTKAPTEAKAVGDIVFTDGSATPYSAALALTNEQKAAAIAVIFDATNKLGVGLVKGNLAWAKNGTTGNTNKITDLVCSPIGGGDASTATFSTGATDGSPSLKTFKDFVKDNGNDYSEENYPAWAWIEGYAATANLTGTSYESGWYMPSIKELCDLYKVKDAVNNSIEKTGGTQMSTDVYWSSSQNAYPSNSAWYVDFEWGELYYDTKNGTNLVCAFRAFN